MEQQSVVVITFIVVTVVMVIVIIITYRLTSSSISLSSWSSRCVLVARLSFTQFGLYAQWHYIIYPHVYHCKSAKNMAVVNSKVLQRGDAPLGILKTAALKICFQSLMHIMCGRNLSPLPVLSHRFSSTASFAGTSYQAFHFNFSLWCLLKPRY